jgi:hypothetical protein
MDEFFSWLSNQLVGRIDGPLKFRLILQPAVAVFFAIRDGLKDARRGNVPYFWAIFTEPSRRMELIRDGWKSVFKIFVFATVMDLVYQYLVLGWMYPLAALSIAFILAFVPYLVIRGSVNRIARMTGKIAQTEAQRPASTTKTRKSKIEIRNKFK